MYTKNMYSIYCTRKKFSECEVNVLLEDQVIVLCQFM